MKNALLTKEENDIEKNFEQLVPVSTNTRSRIEKIIDGSRKSRPVSLRINETDLIRLKEKANKSGLPYQTMINVVIHKFVTDSFLDKDELNKFLQLKGTFQASPTACFNQTLSAVHTED